MTLADLAHYGDPKRVAIGHTHTMAAIAVSSAGMHLGMWAGHGDWAALSQDNRDKAGQRALNQLDTAISELTAARNELARAVRGQDTSMAAILRLDQNDAYNLDAMLHAGYRQLRDDDIPTASAAALRVLDQVVNAVTPIRLPEGTGASTE